MLDVRVSSWQVRVRARDGGTPERSDVTLVKINVERNLEAPKFEPEEYDVTVMETVALGDSIIKVRATDGDRLVSNT